MFESSNFLTKPVSLYHRKPQNYRNLQSQEQKLKTIAVLPNSYYRAGEDTQSHAGPADILGEGTILLSWVLCGHLNKYKIFHCFLPILLTGHRCCLSTTAFSQTADVNATSPLSLLCYPFFQVPLYFQWCLFHSTFLSSNFPLGNHSWICLVVFSVEGTTFSAAHGNITAFPSLITAQQLKQASRGNLQALVYKAYGCCPTTSLCSTSSSWKCNHGAVHIFKV